MVDPIDERAARLKALNASYEERLPSKIAVIEELGTRLELEGWSEDLLRMLRFHCHNLEGTAATFGFSSVTYAARAIGDTLRRYQGVLQVPSADEVRLLAKLIADLRRAAEP